MPRTALVEMDHAADGPEPFEKGCGLPVLPNHVDVLREPGKANKRPLPRAENLVADAYPVGLCVAGFRAREGHIADSRRLEAESDGHRYR